MLGPPQSNTVSPSSFVFALTFQFDLLAIIDFDYSYFVQKP